jgi:hypothetical protein
MTLAELQHTSKCERHLRRRLAAKYLEEECGFRCSARQLAKLACAGGGPPMRYRNALPYYPTDGLRSWVETGFGPPVTSTSAIKRSGHPASKARLDNALTRRVDAKVAPTTPPTSNRQRTGKQPASAQI